MSKLTIELPEPLRKAAVEAAAASGFSLEHLVEVALTEKLTGLRAMEFLRREGGAGRREDFERFLAAVPDHEPGETDRLPE